MKLITQNFHNLFYVYTMDRNHKAQLTITSDISLIVLLYTNRLVVMKTFLFFKLLHQ